MDAESIIFIVIAIVLAIINGIAKQKKAKKATVSPNQVVFDELPLDDEPMLFSNLSDAPSSINIEEQPHSKDIDLNEHKGFHMPQTELQRQMEIRRKKEVMAAQKYASDDLEKNQVRDKITKETPIEDEKIEEGLIEDFNAKKAIIYSEIIKPKYF